MNELLVSERVTGLPPLLARQTEQDGGLIGVWESIPPEMQLGLVGFLTVLAALGFMGMRAMAGHVKDWQEAYREQRDYYRYRSRRK